MKQDEKTLLKLCQNIGERTCLLSLKVGIDMIASLTPTVESTPSRLLFRTAKLATNLIAAWNLTGRPGKGRLSGDPACASYYSVVSSFLSEFDNYIKKNLNEPLDVDVLEDACEIARELKALDLGSREEGLKMSLNSRLSATLISDGEATKGDAAAKIFGILSRDSVRDKH
eukprot:GHVU01008613.1.p2 GENE.GHVU01008613.1~~GHVU01008613.1.p2  ORF type:complete len:171 (+),score=12.85 GHVU01008613.1:1670-2182(+)